MLDLVITNEEDMIKDMEYLSPLGKNNHLISIVKTAEKKIISCRDTGDYEAMRKELRNIVNYKKEETASTSSGYLSKKQFIKDAENILPRGTEKTRNGKGNIKPDIIKKVTKLVYLVHFSPLPGMQDVCLEISYPFKTQSTAYTHLVFTGFPKSE